MVEPVVPAATIRAQFLAGTPSGASLTPFLFLDIDGVLNSVASRRQRLDEGADFLTASLPTAEHLRVLKHIVVATGSKIVLSSSWRLTADDRDAVVRALSEHGLTIFSCTPDLAGAGGAADRTAEILSWLHDVCSTGMPWLALDDLDLHGWCPGKIDAQHLEKTDDAEGLSHVNAQSAISKLLRQMASIECGTVQTVIQRHVIRPAIPADAAEVAACWERSYHDQPGVLRLPAEFLAERTLPFFLTRAHGRIREMIVACDATSGTIVGFSVARSEPTLELEQMFVDASERRTGLAARLFAAAENRLATIARAGRTLGQLEKTERVGAVLFVFVENEVARRFYEKHGWSNAGPVSHPLEISGGGVFSIELLKYTKVLRL